MEIPKNNITEQHLTQDLRGKFNSLMSSGSTTINNYNSETILQQNYFTMICAESIFIQAIAEDSSGKAINANASDDKPAIGIAWNWGNAGYEIKVLQSGKISIPGASFTINEDIWLSEQVGGGINLTTNKPEPSEGIIIQRLGKSLSTSVMLIEIAAPEKVY